MAAPLYMGVGCSSNDGCLNRLRRAIRIFLICSLYAWKKAFWSHLKRQQVCAFPYQSPWTNLLSTKGILRLNRVDSPGTHILICWKQLLRLPRLFVLLQSCLPICNWLNRTYGRAGRLCLRPECYPRSNSRTKLKSLLIPAHACFPCLSKRRKDARATLSLIYAIWR